MKLTGPPMVANRHNLDGTRQPWAVNPLHLAVAQRASAGPGDCTLGKGPGSFRTTPARPPRLPPATPPRIGVRGLLSDTGVGGRLTSLGF